MLQGRLAAGGIAIAILGFGWLTAGPAGAAWPDNAFPKRSHDFGTVAVAAKTEVSFPVFNPYNQPLHIRNVRRSCGCTTPVVESEYIQPGETGAILAKFNTDTFRGSKGATLTVVVDKPFYSEVRLRVDGYIRSDIVFHPGELEFGTIDRGESVSKSVRVLYAGRDDWQLVELRSNVPWLVPNKKRVRDGGGQIEYELTVAVREDAPQGMFQNEIVLLTNDSKRPEVPLTVTGKVDSPLTISPQAIALGSLKPGQEVKKTLVIKGAQPFRIGKITCKGWDVSYPPTAEPKLMHVVPARFMATGGEGPQKVTVEIATAGENSVTAKAVLTADVRSE